MSKYAYPITTNPVTITLYSNVPFDNTYKHHSFIYGNMGYNNGISPKGAYPHNVKQECFLDRKVLGGNFKYRRWTLTDTFNFDFKNGLIGSVTLELTYEKTNANYMKVVSGNQTWFYFITSIVQNNIDTYTLSLECDVLMTYGNDFITGIDDRPVFTSRKHCHRYTMDGLNPYCADFKTGDSAFAGVKPNIVKTIEKLHSHNNALNNNIDSVVWLYICFSAGKTQDELALSFLYKCQDKKYPLTMLAIPINVNSFTIKNSDNSIHKTWTKSNIESAISRLIDNGQVHGAKLSPYPPYTTRNHTMDTERNLTYIGSFEGTAINQLYYFGNANDTIFIANINATGSGELFDLTSLGCLVISEQKYFEYDYDSCTFDREIINSNAPSINVSRYKDPKLLFSPFKKYILMGQYSSEGSEFYPELLYSDYTTIGYGYFDFATISSAYIGDNNFYTYLKPVNISSDDVFENYNYYKVGLSSSVNYQMPCGTNALDVFNTTQAQSFYTSKVASGVTSGLSIAGGVASMVIGAGMTGASAGTLSPMGMAMVAGGAMGVASGTAGIATTIASGVSKVEDLKNTPDSINISGSNFITDSGIAKDTNCLPYITILECSNVIQENADDFFYNYGYEVSRECHFNTNVYFNNSNNKVIDNNLFGRTIFNYIQIKDDITNKIDSDIPMIVKQKLSTIFNNGITLWTFFGFNFTENGYQDTLNYQIDTWLFKNNLDNTEYKGENNYE